MSARLLLAAGLLLTQTLAAAAGAYRFSRPVEWHSAGAEELLAVPLDSGIYAATRNDFADLRIVDGQGVETPYLLQKAVETRTETSRLQCASEVLSLKKQGAEAIEIVLRLDKNAPAADGMTVVTPLTNFEHSLQVFASNDGKQWTQLVKDIEIYDYSRYMAVGNRDIALPANDYRQFKIVIEKATQSREAELLQLTRTLRPDAGEERSERIALQRIPLRIERIDLWRTKTEVLPESEKQFDYPVAGFKVSQDAEHKTTVIDVETRREPLTGLVLQTPERNFSRGAAVQIPVTQGVATRMQEIGAATLEALHFRDVNRDQKRIFFPEQRQGKYRILIRNQDNPPLEISGVDAVGHGYNLLFLPQAGKTYSLQYGAEKAELPKYDTAPIRELLRRGYQSAAVTLGAETAAAAVEAPFDFAELLNSEWFLGVVVTLMVLVLGWSIYRATKRLEQFPKQ